MGMRFFMLIASGLMLGACGDASNLEKTESFEGKLRATYGEKPGSMAYGIVKNSVAGDSWLATVHGDPDNEAVCEELIAEYNESPEMSVLAGTYRCDPIVGR